MVIPLLNFSRAFDDCMGSADFDFEEREDLVDDEVVSQQVSVGSVSPRSLAISVDARRYCQVEAFWADRPQDVVNTVRSSPII